ncbi:unnamed protein product [Cylicocyclus nassatus]|uniref:Uncharacterized protein n=1 Tax=Cylicocyclus nassatus TaxID=53992 RepID=A0AA36M3Q2_CYLNA|nr:unnamed protein product [Cylicocyclus nassatus]
MSKEYSPSELIEMITILVLLFQFSAYNLTWECIIESCGRRCWLWTSMEPLTMKMMWSKTGESLKTTILSRESGDLAKELYRRFQHSLPPNRLETVFNITKSAVGVIVNKRVRGRIIPKCINIRVEHVKPSTCRQDFLNRVKANDEKKKAPKAAVLADFVNGNIFGPSPRPPPFLAADANH